MNDTELFSLCREVYKRFPEWDGGKQFAYDLTYADKWLRYIGDFSHDTREWRLESMAPLYDSDYLLKKLPPVIQDPCDKVFKHLLMWVNGDKSTHAGYVEPYAHDDKVAFAQKSDEMRKTILKLVLALDDAGVKLEAQ